jgi:adenylate kinase family enzyme
MIVLYLFSSPEGDIPLETNDLSRPFLITPEKAHPHLSLGNYFDAMKACVLENRGELIKRALRGEWHEDWCLDDVAKIKIRSEKHGILYHLASVEVFLKETRVKFTLSTALYKAGIDCLVREHDVLDRLNHTYQCFFLPEVYGIREMACSTDQGTTEKMVMMSAHWFEDYHEWHLAMDPVDGRRKFKIWDLRKGHRYASSTEAFRIIEECSKILAFYYDHGDFSQIGAWHHAAGDFIVNTREDGKLNVRLTTVRKYEPLMASFSERNVNPVIAMIYFFLDTTLHMRLDRLDGVGEKVWLDDFAVAATIKGFFKGLHEQETNEDGVSGVQAAELLSLVKSFDGSEFERIFEPLMDHYATQDPEGMAFMGARMDDHINVLRQALQDFH